MGSLSQGDCKGSQAVEATPLGSVVVTECTGWERSLGDYRGLPVRRSEEDAEGAADEDSRTVLTADTRTVVGHSGGVAVGDGTASAVDAVAVAAPASAARVIAVVVVVTPAAAVIAPDGMAADCRAGAVVPNILELGAAGTERGVVGFAPAAMLVATLAESVLAPKAPSG